MVGLNCLDREWKLCLAQRGAYSCKAKSRNMKLLCLTLTLVFSLASLAIAQEKAFTSLDKVMDPSTYQKAGLPKLSDEEREVLNNFLKDYISSKQKAAADVAAAAAVDRAVKERRVRPPEIIESRIVGTYKGYGLRTLFPLANGQVWRPTNSDIVNSSPVQNPAVVIYRDFFGYKMFIENASVVRVKRVK